MRRLIAPLLIGILGAAVLSGLGIWQVQRLQWKEGVLAEIEARIADDPVPVPGAPDPERDRYLPVEASGTIGDEALRVLVSIKGIGPAYRIVSAVSSAETIR